MNKPYRMLFLFVLLFGFIALPAMAADKADRFSLLSKEPNSSYFLDVKTLYHMPADTGTDFTRNPDQLLKDKGFVEAWVKVEYSKAGPKEVIDSLAAQGQEVTGYEKLAFSFQRLRVRPASLEVAVLEQVDYDKNGTLIGHSVYPADGWVPLRSLDARAADICSKLIIAQKTAYASGSR